MTMTTREARVLAVLDDEALTPQPQVIRLARMAPARAITALAWLVEDGRVQRFTAQPIGRGRPSFLYRRTPQRAA